MEIKPVPQIEAPAYPTRDELLADKKILQECVPSRWRKTRGLAGAVALCLAANLSGCGGEPRETAKVAEKPPVKSEEEASDPFSPSAESAESAESTDTVAPPIVEDPLIEKASAWIQSIYEDRSGGSGSSFGGVILFTPPGNK